MATVASVRAAISLRIGSLDWVDQGLATMMKREAIAAGETAFYILPSVVGFDKSDAQIGYAQANYAITFAHKLADAQYATEATYVLVTSLLNQEVVMAKSFYSSILGVNEIKGAPELTPAERTPESGNVVEWTVDVQLTIEP